MIDLENQILVFLRVADLHRFYCIVIFNSRTAIGADSLFVFVHPTGCSGVCFCPDFEIKNFIFFLVLQSSCEAR